MNTMQLLSTLDLLSALEGLVTEDRANTAELIRIMERVDADKLFAAEGYASMFAFCVERFLMSEAQANKRIRVARMARLFPGVIPMLRRGEVHLSGLCILASHLTDQNHADVLRRAKGLTIRETEKLVREIQPLPDVPTRLRAVPRPRKSKLGREHSRPELALTARPPIPPIPRAKDPEPLSPKRFKLTVTISEETNQTLEQLQQLMSHQLPGGDPAAIVEKALALLLEQRLREKAAQVRKPREVRPRKSGSRSPSSRAIPANVKREVWKRDNGRCCFKGANGHACASKRHIEFNHRVPFAKGGGHSIDNIELRCRAHNQLQAEQDYGLPFMAKKRGTSVRESTLLYGAEQGLDSTVRSERPRSLQPFFEVDVVPLGSSRWTRPELGRTAGSEPALA